MDTSSQPFYSPPRRLALQTPCEIIREARQDVMGIRAVPTSRPFTPKERERVLFGGAKRGSSRPPSAVNLSYLQRQEPVSRVKLPSINLPTRNRPRAVSTRTVLSLDNLVEEYEGEPIPVANATFEDLAGVRKSYSCPQERSINVTTPDSSARSKENMPREGWTVERTLESKIPRQTSELKKSQKKKIHRLQSLPRESSMENLKFDDREEDENVLFSRVDASVKLKTETNPNNSDVLLESTTSFNTADETQEDSHLEKVVPSPVQEKGDVSPKQQDVDNTKKVQAPQQSDANSTQGPDDNLVAVLSEGKLVWEAPRENPKVNYEIIIAPEPPSKSDKPSSISTTNHLQSLRKNLNNVSSGIQILQNKIDKVGARVGKKEINGPNYTFHMNSNVRYHTSKSIKTGGGGEKAYKKWSENAMAVEREEKESINARKSSDPAGWDFFWKNSYFRSKEEELDPAVQYLQDVLEELRVMHTKDGETLAAEDKISSLYTSLKSGDYFSQGSLPPSFRSKLLQTLYMYANSDTPKLLLYIARIVFGLRVETGLPAACKMVFKVARSDANDHLFIDIEDILELFLDGIGRASPLDAAESCIYGYGALKFLTMNPLLLNRALHFGALDLITLHLKMVNSSIEEGIQVGEQTQHALFQLTGTLRNIAAGDGAIPLFLTTNCIPAICKTLVLFRGDEELVSNIARTLSILSSDPDVSQVLVGVSDFVLTVIDVIRQYQQQDQILIRFSYMLGNILANSDIARVQLFRNERSLPTLLTVLQTYMEKDSAIQGDQSEGEAQETVNDVLVKVIRVVANMSMNPVVGSNLSPATQEKNSLQLAALLTALLTRKQPGAAVLATLGCLNNISYYVSSHTSLVQLTKGVMGVLDGSPPHDCIIEATRVLGNLTRHKDTRDFIFSNGGMEILERLLRMEDPEVAKCVCGAMVNMLLDTKTRKAFLANHGVDKLLGAAERFQGDWILAGLVCRGIWNACAQDIASAVEHNNMDHLLTTLANYLEEDDWKDGDADWEEFAGIATDLLERFNAHLEAVE